MADDIALKVNTLESLAKQNMEDHKEIKDTLKDVVNKLENIEERLEKKFAPIWVRDVMIWCGITIGGVLLIYAVKTIFNLS